LSTETLTFLFTDIEGSTELLRHVGPDVYAQLLADHHGLIRAQLLAFGGQEVVTQGDSFFAVFRSSSACAAAVVEMQLALTRHEWPGHEQARVRMGVHSGEAEETATGLVGLDIHRAARLAAVGHGGQMLMSASAAALVRDSLPEGAALRDLGLHRLKDLGHSVQIYQLQAGELQSEFPPLRSLDNPALPNNLPAQSASFVGRDQEVSEVKGLVQSSRLVTLTGAGGSGKTRLALQVAAELLDGSGDGVWLVELAAVTDEEAVVSTMAQTLGIRAQAGRPALDTLVDAVSPQQLLIVLDNCEHLIGACAKLTDAILRRCPKAHVMATSREPLGIGGEAVYRVPSLSLPPANCDLAAAASSDAIILFLDRSNAQGINLSLTEDTGPLLVSICRRLDGMPLAIELAAARLRLLSLRDLSERLDQRFRLLTGGSRSVLPRQQTLRATVDWSYSLLSDPEQHLLARLSVFREGFDLNAAEAVCGFDDIELFDVTDLLGSLVDKSLVVAEQDDGTVRYRLLETIREFAAGRLVESGDEAVKVAGAHRRHFLGLAERGAPHLTGPHQGEWFSRFDADRANLRRAMEHAAASTDGVEDVLRFAVALRRYWWVRHSYAEVTEILMPVLETQAPAGQSVLLGRSLVTAAIVNRTFDLRIAMRLADWALNMAQELGDDRLFIEAAGVCCAVSYFTGDVARGLALGEAAVERARQAGDDVALCESLALLLVCRQHGDPVLSAALFSEATTYAQRMGDHTLTHMLENNAAVFELEKGDIASAREHLERATKAGAVIRLLDESVITNFAWVLRAQGDEDGARSKFHEIMQTCRRNGNRIAVAYSVLGLACLAVDNRDWLRAAALFGAADESFERNGQTCEELEARYRRAGIEKLQKRVGEESFDRAYTDGRAIGFDEMFDLALGRLQMMRGPTPRRSRPA